MQKYHEQKSVLRFIPYLENAIIDFNLLDNQFPLNESRC
jgi:hypothetical protein